MEGTAAAAQTPSDAGQAQPASSQTNDQVVLSKADYEKLNRQAQQGLGAQAIYEAARSVGRTRVEDIISALKPTEPSQTAPVPASPAGAGALSFDDPDVKEMVRAEFAVRDHRAAVEQQEEMIRKLAIEAVGESATEFEREAAIALLAKEAEQKAEMYPVGHPLRTQALAPLPKKVLEELASQIKAKRGATKGAAMAAAARSTQTVPSVIGSPGSAGAPVAGGQPRPVRFSQLTRAEQEAWLASRKGAQ